MKCQQEGRPRERRTLTPEINKKKSTKNYTSATSEARPVGNYEIGSRVVGLARQLWGGLARGV